MGVHVHVHAHAYLLVYVSRHLLCGGRSCHTQFSINLVLLLGHRSMFYGFGPTSQYQQQDQPSSCFLA
jgi:hypothetical protein